MATRPPARRPWRLSRGSGIGDDTLALKHPLEDHYDVIADGAVAARIMLFTSPSTDLPWVWTKAPGNEFFSTRLASCVRPQRNPSLRGTNGRGRLTVFQHACKMGLERHRLEAPGSRYRSARSPDWLKFKNPEAPAVKREAEEDWAK